MGVALEPRGKHRRRDDEGDQANRHVDVEDPTPTEVIDEEPAGERAGDACDREDGPRVPLVSAAFARRHDVADDGHRHRDKTTRAHPLDCPKRDELAKVLCRAREHRANEKHDDRDLEHSLPASDVADLSVQGRRSGRCQQVHGDHPREMVQATEISHDRGECGCNDRRSVRRTAGGPRRPCIVPPRSRPRVGRPPRRARPAPRRRRPHAAVRGKPARTGTVQHDVAAVPADAVLAPTRVGPLRLVLG